MALIAQLGEHCTSIAEVVDSNPAQSLNFFSGLCSSSVTAALALITVALNCYYGTIYSHKLYALANPPKLPRSVLKDLLVFATKRSHFVFDGQYYDQIDGVAMGSPLGPVLANIFMCDFEEKWVMNNGARPTIWFRYVDDTFTLFPNKDTAVQFLSYLNTRHKNIQFTTEFEQDEEIPFLDVLIKRQPNNSFSTSIYRKKTFTGLYTQWDSFTPRKYKVNLIRTLTYRCLRICSSPRLLQSALDDLKKQLSRNGYPVVLFHIT